MRSSRHQQGEAGHSVQYQVALDLSSTAQSSGDRNCRNSSPPNKASNSCIACRSMPSHNQAGADSGGEVRRKRNRTPRIPRRSAQSDLTRPDSVGHAWQRGSAASLNPLFRKRCFLIGEQPSWRGRHVVKRRKASKSREFHCPVHPKAKNCRVIALCTAVSRCELHTWLRPSFLM
jgi:hypothetical protein